MKKIIYFMLVITLVLLSGCESSNHSNTNSSLEAESSQRDVRYAAVNVSYEVYNTAKELVDVSKVVVSGKVTGFTFVA